MAAFLQSAAMGGRLQRGDPARRSHQRARGIPRERAFATLACAKWMGAHRRISGILQPSVCRAAQGIMNAAKPVTIIGGGLAGLALGIGLRQRDVPVAVWEKTG